MTIYVFDTGAFIDLFRHYYRDRFPSLWKRFDVLIEKERITSTREVLNELQGHDDDLSIWCKEHRGLFTIPSPDEMGVVTKIFAVTHFQTMIRQRERIKGKPVADPFVIARAMCLKNGCVVTMEHNSPNAAMIPNVC